MEYKDEDLEQSIEETRQDIEEKRASISEKLELLEERVRDTLEETRSAVEGIVENVKETVDETVGVVKETVEGARSTVDTFVENVKETVDETTTLVKHSFDLSYQVEHHPWLMMGGSVLVGYFLGNWLSPRASYPQGDRDRAYSAEDDVFYAASMQEETKVNNLETTRAHPEKREDSKNYPAPGKSTSYTQPRRWSNLLGPFQEEWDALKGVALGTLMGTLRTLVRQNMPAVAPKLEQAINSAAAKLGTEPIDFPSEQDHSPENNGHTQSRELSPGERQGSQTSPSNEGSPGGQIPEPLAAKGISRNPI